MPVGTSEGTYLFALCLPAGGGGGGGGTYLLANRPPTTCPIR